MAKCWLKSREPSAVSTKECATLAMLF